MFRTRDFVLYFTAIAFLLMAIGVTLFDQNQRSNAVITEAVPVPLEIDSVSATVASAEPGSMTREERLAAMKAKINQGELIDISAPDPEPLSVDQIRDSEENRDESAMEPSLLLCESYDPEPSFNWPVSTLQTESVEGVRQYYEVIDSAVSSSSSSTRDKVVRLTLPVKFVPFGGPKCIPQGVIGVALDNSLIMNTETGLYSIFGSETLIGYALDGYPLYGLGTEPTDSCGGRIELGQYRYELSASRETVLNCFASEPAQL